MNIETKWLEDFLSLARTQSFSRSAEERHLTQPAFSRRIKALEASLGCELVDRTSMPVQLTREGRLFQITARNLVSQLDDCVTHIRSLGRGEESVIDFAVSHTLALSFFPEFLKSLNTTEASFRSRQLIANVDDSVQALKNGICDFLLAFENHTLDSTQFAKLYLRTERLLPVCRGGDEGKPQYSLDEETRMSLPYLGYPKDIYLGRMVAGLLRHPPRKVDLQLVSESSMADSLKVMAMQGMGIAWVPSFSIREEVRQGFLVCCGEETWHIPLQICIYRCMRTLSPEAEALWKVLESEYSVDDQSS
ncbi:LysR family transcriptional regulator [Hahella sp. CCB-MM4]|uniref:LysR family transcriptional regulator n=1 Tax=Hahella sp. (strain CCB-MM4) TaxID=1926491 RepID=UPI000B9A29FA|nr:LysR family transcriptional regulator [Hahella sp. CCB-MM4]OZG71103.1 LysR family transcriptional regulator [Hahella sp. CCB-MM4]